jgi:quercetin dioxygenase-like cupin family protein
MRRPVGLVVSVLAIVSLAVGCADDATTDGAGTTATTSAESKVSSEVLAEYAPPEAPGFTMYLYRVTVPPGVEIPSHHHPGQQMARIDAGTLTYTVEQGTIQIARQGSEPTETVNGPATVELNAGDTIYEAETDIHHATNQGDVDVDIVITSLITTGQPLSLPTN